MESQLTAAQLRPASTENGDTLDVVSDRVGSTDGCNTSVILEVVLSSSRRVKKGPGRRPQSAKRRRFMELRERGLGIDAAARAVGASRSAGRNWANGYKQYPAGDVVRVVPAGSPRGARDQ